MSKSVTEVVTATNLKSELVDDGVGIPLYQVQATLHFQQREKHISRITSLINGRFSYLIKAKEGDDVLCKYFLFPFGFIWVRSIDQI